VLFTGFILSNKVECRLEKSALEVRRNILENDDKTRMDFLFGVESLQIKCILRDENEFVISNAPMSS
jgi:hypothetical protein